MAAARSAEAVRNAERRARQSTVKLQPVAARVADLHRDNEMRHLAAARAHADHASSLRRLAGESDDTLDRVFMSAVAGASGTCNAVLAVPGAGQPEALVTPSDTLAGAAHDLEATCGEGPGRDAVSAGGVVQVTGDALGSTWPLYGPAVERLGVYHVSAAPLRAAGRCLGTVTTLCWKPGGCCRGVPLDWLAGALVSALLDNDTTVTDADGVPVDPPLDGKQIIVHQAAGMVAARSGVDIAAALDMIRARAFADSQPAESVAAQILNHRRDPGLGN